MSVYHAHVKSSTNRSFQDALLLSLMENSDDEEDVCLITGESFESYPETERYQLPCGHAFLKTAIYQEVRKQKYDWKYNKNVAQYTVHFYKKLRINQMMCPYCRKIHEWLLPSWEGFEKLHGVNSPEKYTAKKNKCAYILMSGKRKGQRCGVYCNDDYCKRHMNSQKQKDEEAKICEKENTVQSMIQPSNMPNTPQLCNAILKSGKRKGEPCNASCKKVILVNNKQQWVCGRHCNPGTTFQ